MFFKKKLIKKIKEKFKKIKSRYNEKLQKERNKFTCILNHDIKTPLLAQIQSLELILKERFGKLNSEQKDILSEILNSNYFLFEIISNTIFLAKYESEKPQPKLENIDILEQIQDCCNMIKNFAKEKNQNIVVKTNKKNEIKLKADRLMIQKIIFNILSSSISYGFEKSDIEILVKESKKSISFCTKNKSIYMTKEKINSLFEDKKNLCDFNQLGMSLNLNIAKKLINAHNWNIIAESRQNNSSTFGFVVKK